MRLYDRKAWLHLRKAHLLMEPLCRMCKAAGIIRPANHVDHIIPISKGGDHLPDHDGLQSLCHECHSVKTAQDMGRTPRQIQPGCNTSGVPTDKRHHWNC